MFQPRVQMLESRLVPTQIVTNINNSGPGSLRQAIIEVNKLPGGDTVDFNIPGPGVHTIMPSIDLPPISSPVVIDATSQPGYTPGAPLIELNGSNGLSDGLVLEIGSSTVEGMVINSFADAGLILLNKGNNIIVANFIGTNATGTNAMGNELGIDIEFGCNNNMIGGNAPALGNLISGNFGSGFLVQSNGNIVRGNYIGTDVTGTQRLGNDVGITISGGTDNTIGGTTSISKNIISGNRYDGLDLTFLSDINTILGNYIGLDVTGRLALGNGHDGITVASNNNLIGGTILGSGNVISGNEGAGIGIVSGSDTNSVQGNLIGTDVSGTAAIGNLYGIADYGRNTLIGGSIPGSKNLVSGNGADGIYISGGEDIQVSGNYVGTDRRGMLPVPNGGFGVNVDNGRFNVIGGTSAGGRNLISGNAQGGVLLVGFNTEGNVVEGNYIGTDAPGTEAVGNAGNGITVSAEANGNTIGGTIVVGGINVSGNLVSGNANIGVEITEFAPGNVIEGNYIGTDESASFAIPNGAGAAIDGFSRDNHIGGTVTAARNIISGNRTYGVGVFDRLTTANLVQGNYIGTDLTGTQAIPNDEGVDIFSAASGNIIGGTALGCTRNLISGNTHEGVHIFDRNTSDVVQNNYIGTDLSGTVALPNGFGVSITGGASGNLIGGTILAGTMNSGARNIISGNTHYGVGLLDSHTSFNIIQGNYIGTDVSGTLALGNSDDGILLPNGGLSGAANQNTVGGTDPLEGNIVAYNGVDGVHVDTGTGNSVRANRIFGHFSGLGIELANGGNNNQAAPRLRSATSNGTDTFIRGSLRSIPDTTFTLDFFSNMSCDPSGLGEGEVFLGSAVVTTDPNGHARIRVDLALSVPAGEFVTATATSPLGDTSEFSNCQVVTALVAPDPSAPYHSELAGAAEAFRAATPTTGSTPAERARSTLDLTGLDWYSAQLGDVGGAPVSIPLSWPCTVRPAPVRASATGEGDARSIEPLAAEFQL
jgi:titin